MLISELNVLETVEGAKAQGGIINRTFKQLDIVGLSFGATNQFAFNIIVPVDPNNNSASSAAKSEAQNNSFSRFGVELPTNSFTKADTIAATELFGSSFSGSVSGAVISLAD